ncbi:MAG TPA: hypothetical protein VI389_04850, partial [Geobacteraceae bacterium]
AEATLYLGIALSRNKDPQADEVLIHALSLEPANPLTNLELGIRNFNNGVFAEAGDYFENLITIAPGSEYSTLAEEYLRRIKEKTRAKRWGLRFTAGMQYDSNVILNADGTPLPQGVSRRSDWRGIINAGLNYSLLRTDRFAVDAGYSLYQSLHVRLSDFDITQNLVELAGKYRLSSIATARLTYNFEYLHLGGEAYDTAHTVAPALIFASDKGYSMTLDYRYRNSDFRNSPAFPTNDERTGENHQVGVSLRLPLADSLSGRIGYYHDEERTRLVTWDYTGDRWDAGITTTLPLTFILDLGGEYYLKKYPTFDVVPREDHTYSGSISATKLFADTYGITASYYYSRNQSDVPTYDYVRHITSLMFNARY